MKVTNPVKRNTYFLQVDCWCFAKIEVVRYRISVCAVVLGRLSLLHFTAFATCRKLQLFLLTVLSQCTVAGKNLEYAVVRDGDYLTSGLENLTTK